MGTCFVMQPFDKGKFDKRYADVFEPAIKDAGLEPYRVDKDPSVSIPIEEIETGIRQSEICFAEITTNNPNVWFELGYAIAVHKEVVLVCSDDRNSNYPFDVQYRSIIEYKTESPQDFEVLRKEITERIIATLKKQKEIGKVSNISPLAETHGLAPHEIVCLVTITENSAMPHGISANWILSDMNNAGYTAIAANLAIKSLLSKEMIEQLVSSNEYGEEYYSYVSSNKGDQWLLNNIDKLVLKKDTPPDNIFDPNNSDDIPF